MKKCSKFVYHIFSFFSPFLNKYQWNKSKDLFCIWYISGKVCDLLILCFHCHHFNHIFKEGVAFSLVSYLFARTIQLLITCSPVSCLTSEFEGLQRFCVPSDRCPLMSWGTCDRVPSSDSGHTCDSTVPALLGQCETWMQRTIAKTDQVLLA